MKSKSTHCAAKLSLVIISDVFGVINTATLKDKFAQ